MTNRLLRLIRAFAHLEPHEAKIPTDPLGSYTGVPDDPHDRPEQDADDL